MEQLVGAIVGLVPYVIVGFDDVAADRPASAHSSSPRPATPRTGFAPGEPLTCYVGGDEGFAASLECRRRGPSAS